MYSRGTHRLFYKSNDDISQTITTKIITPDLETKGPFTMNFLSEGLYYIDVVFTKLGSHVFYVYENDVKKHEEILVVSNGQYLIYPKGNII